MKIETKELIRQINMLRDNIVENKDYDAMQKTMYLKGINDALFVISICMVTGKMGE